MASPSRECAWHDPTGPLTLSEDYVDPLADANSCARDVPQLQELGVNAVRVYSVNPALDHDACMKALDDAGIYVLLDVSLPLNGSIDRASPTWDTSLLDEYMRTINVFNRYSNILGYNIGNEVVNVPNNTNAARAYPAPQPATSLQDLTLAQPLSRPPPATPRHTSAASTRRRLSAMRRSTRTPSSATTLLTTSPAAMTALPSTCTA